MTGDAEDREAIRHLLATYTVNGDRGRVAALGEVFTRDGAITFSGETTRGRAEIVARLSRGGLRDPAPAVVRHHLTSSLIQTDGDAASARSYFQVLTDRGLDHHGVYVDRLARTPEGWRIADRDVRIDYQAPDSFYAPFHVRGRPPV